MVGKGAVKNIRFQTLKKLDFISWHVNNLDDEKDSLTRKTINKPKAKFLEDAGLTWCMQKRASGQPKGVLL